MKKLTSAELLEAMQKDIALLLNNHGEKGYANA